MASKDQSFLGTGWNFPPAFSSKTNTAKTVSGVDDINQSLQILFATAFGERVKRENFGSNMESFVFEPTTTNGLASLKSLVEKAILLNEPRIKLDNVSLTTNVNEGLINIKIDYTVRTTNSRTNFVYPFYIKEANNL